MYQCPDCGGNLKFDIPTQMLSCAYCDAKYNPYSVVKEADAQRNEFFEATVFSCPQCGGEVYSVDNEAASFCSYCGASAILTERISNEKCPDQIIPFKITKEDCKKAYKKAMSKAFFTPKELKNSKYIDGFRGIYMPYWNYSVTQKGMLNIPGHKSHRSGDYIITEHYDMKGHISSTFAGDIHDSSSNFYDEISESLAPYDVSECIDFTPSFLSGFYADASDVESGVYEEKTINFAEETNIDKVCREFKGGYSINKDKENFKQWPLSKIEDTKSAMFPVWFLSYRNKDRVAYATVNGQTGKVVADLPISPMKYILTSFIMAIPIFILLNMFSVLIPSVLLCICSVILAITAVICKSEIKAIYRKENNIGDLGVSWRNLIKRKRHLESEFDVGEPYEIKNTRKKGKLSVFSFMAICCVPIIMLGAFLDKFMMSVYAIVTIIILLTLGSAYKQNKEIENFGKPTGMIFSAIASAIAIFIAFVNPVSDIWYYSGVIIILFAILVNFIFIIRYYNRIAMRRLPQFDKKGGDDRAY